MSRLRLPVRLAVCAGGLVVAAAPALAGQPARAQTLPTIPAPPSFTSPPLSTASSPSTTTPASTSSGSSTPTTAASGGSPGSGLGGYRISSQAAGETITYNDGSEAEVTVPDAQTSFSTGAGHALASALYPGPVGANPGATLQQFLGADLPSQVVDALATTQDPFKAEAYSSGPNDSSFPSGGPPQAVSNTAHADASSATAAGTMVNQGESSEAKSATTINAASVTTTASSSASGISVGGVVEIADVTSTATAASDGTTGTGDASTTISGFTAAGQAVSFDGTGLTVGPAKVPVDLSPVVNAALKSSGISMTVTPGTKTVNGAQVDVQASSVTIFVNLPDNGGNTFTITLGGATADAIASQAYNAPPLPAAAPSSSSPAASGPIATGPTGVVTNAPQTAAPTNDSGSAFSPATTVPTRNFSFAPAATDFGGLKAGWVIFGLLVAAGAAFGLGKMPERALADKTGGSPCPLERSGS